VFPTTQISAIAALRSTNAADVRRSWERVIEAYWRPVYKHLRLKWRKTSAEAQDLTQSFFAVAFEREFLGSWDPERARFRTYLKTCVDRFTSNEAAGSGAAKRGGDAVIVPLDVAGAEAELASETVPDVETIFEREWSRSVFALALGKLRAAESGTVRFEIFEAYDLAEPGARPTYEGLATRFGVPATTVTNHLAAMRRALKREVLQTLRELTIDDAEFREEARALLGDPS